MEDAPLNLAHFHERRAVKHLDHHRFDEAIKCLEKSLYYIDEAYKTIQMPKAIEVLVVQEREYKRQIQQILYKKAYYESIKSADDIGKEYSQNEDLSEQTLKDSNELKYGVDKGINDYDTRYSSENDIHGTSEEKSSETDDCLLELELEVKEIPILAPLELPTFDYQVFQRASSNYFRKPNAEALSEKDA